MQIDLRVLGHAIRVTTQDEAVGRAIELFWEPAKAEPGRNPDAKRGRLDYVFEAARLYFRGEIIARANSDGELLSAFERHLLDTLVLASSDACLLHAGAVRMGSDLFVLVGAPGSGKSTLTSLFVGAGADYLSDDLLSVSGEWLDGAARSIQFDAISGEPSTEFLSTKTLVDYPAPGFPPGSLRVPVHGGSYRGVGPVRLYESRPVLVALERGTKTAATTLPALERLSCLHEATLVGGQTYAGGLDHGLGFRLTWSDPEQALQELLASVQAP